MVFPIADDQPGSMFRKKELTRIPPVNQIVAAFIDGHDENMQILTEVLIVSENTTDSRKRWPVIMNVASAGHCFIATAAEKRQKGGGEEGGKMNRSCVPSESQGFNDWPDN